MSETQTGGVNDDPGRIIYDLEQRLAAETKRTEQAKRYVSTNEVLNEKEAEIERLKTELQQAEQWRTAATDAHAQSEAVRIQQAVEIERLQAELRRCEAESHRQLRTLQAEQQAEQRGEREGFRIAIGMILEALK